MSYLRAITYTLSMILVLSLMPASALSVEIPKRTNLFYNGKPLFPSCDAVDRQMEWLRRGEAVLEPMVEGHSDDDVLHYLFILNQHRALFAALADYKMVNCLSV